MGMEGTMDHGIEWVSIYSFLDVMTSGIPIVDVRKEFRFSAQTSVQKWPLAFPNCHIQLSTLSGSVIGYKQLISECFCTRKYSSATQVESISNGLNNPHGHGS